MIGFYLYTKKFRLPTEDAGIRTEDIASVCLDERKAFIFAELLEDRHLSGRDLKLKMDETFPSINSIHLSRAKIRNICRDSLEGLFAKMSYTIKEHPLVGERMTSLWG